MDVQAHKGQPGRTQHTGSRKARAVSDVPEAPILGASALAQPIKRADAAADEASAATLHERRKRERQPTRRTFTVARARGADYAMAQVG
jgi:hypothetical protein